MTITIDKDTVLQFVEMNVSVTGRDYRDANGNNLWDKVKIQERDEPMLLRFWDSAYGHLLKSLDNFVEGHTYTTLTLADNRRMNESVVSDLAAVVQAVLVNFITAEWLKLKAVEFATQYADAAEKGLEDVLYKLRVKNEPIMKKYEYK